MKLASIRLTTRDVPRLAAFYEQLTGIAPWHHPQFPGYAELRLPSITIAIAREDESGPRAPILELEVGDVDAERARLAGLVEHWVMEPTDMPWGNRSALLRDPDGTLLNLYRSIRR